LIQEWWENTAGGQAGVKLVSNAMANATRRKIMASMCKRNGTVEEISAFVPLANRDMT